MTTITIDMTRVEGRLEILQRIRAEYADLPGLTLTLRQAARLWDLDLGQSALLLGELMAEGFLVQDTETGMFKRPGCPECVH
jgi:hypothetical protein